MKTKVNICVITAAGCLVMAFIDGIWQPGYRIKSAFKMLFFAFLPIVYSAMDKQCGIRKVFGFHRKGLKIAAILAVSVYILIISAYFIGQRFIDFSAVAGTLEKSQGVNKSNFITTRIYISFINSLLEEFFFRGFAYLCLKQTAGRNFAFVFSALCFSLYHIAILDGWFSLPVTALTIAALAAGGGMFNLINEKTGGIYASWLVHAAANFGINTAGLFVLGII